MPHNGLFAAKGLTRERPTTRAGRGEQYGGRRIQLFPIVTGLKRQKDMASFFPQQGMHRGLADSRSRVYAQRARGGRIMHADVAFSFALAPNKVDSELKT